jgi:hypothetical protein
VGLTGEAAKLTRFAKKGGKSGTGQTEKSPALPERLVFLSQEDVHATSEKCQEPTLSHDTILSHLPFESSAEAQDEVAGGDRDLAGLSLNHCSPRKCPSDTVTSHPVQMLDYDQPSLA